MHFKCDFFDIDMQNVSRISSLKLIKNKKCLREKYIINNPNFFEVDEFLREYVGRKNKKFDFDLNNCEFKLELNNNFNPSIKREYFYNIDIISRKKHLLYWIEYFMSRGYKISRINEMIIHTLSNRRNVT